MGKKKQRKTLFWNFIFGTLVLGGLSVVAITSSRLPAQGSEGGSTSSRPDIVIQNLQFVSQSSDLATVEYDVANTGTGSVKDWFSMAVYIDGSIQTNTYYVQQKDGTQYGVDADAVIPIATEGKYHVALGNYYWLAEGSHTIKVVADKVDFGKELSSWVRNILRDNMISESNEGNNAAEISVAQSSASSSASTNTNQADVSISLNGPSGSLPIGSLSSVNITIRNAGPANSGPINFTATIPQGTSMTLSESDKKYCRLDVHLYCVLPELPAGGVNSISTFVYKIVQGASCSEPIVISMSATGTSTDGNSGNNQASTSLAVQCANQYGTSGGFNLPPPPSQEGTGGCTDSDGGEKYDVQGVTESPGSWSRDHCQNVYDPKSKLIEYYCSPQGGSMSRTVSCPYGCEQGACEPQGGSACVNIREQAACETSERSGTRCRWDTRTGLCSPSDVNATSSVSSAIQDYSSTYSTSSPARSAERSSKMPRLSSGSPIEYEDEVHTAEPTSRFKDIGVSSLEGQAANELAARNIIGGFPDGEFKGSRSVNRAEAAKFLVLARFKDVEDRTNDGKFWDVLEGEWYEKYVVQAADHDIISGHPDGSFRPADGVNTAEFLKMLSLTFALPTERPHSYRDVPSDAWYALYAGSAQELILFPRRARGALEPGKFLTREEVAVAIYRVLLSLAPPGNRVEKGRTYENEQFGIGFTYPMSWGPAVVSPLLSLDMKEEVLKFTALEEANVYPSTHYASVGIDFRPFDEQDARWEKICSSYDPDDEDMCHRKDLLVERDAIRTNPDLVVHGIPVGVHDVYSAPGGNVSRVYTIFMPHHRMKIFANHDVDAIYDQKYQERRDRGEHPSILELVHEDLGMEAKDPIRRLIKLYPRETDRMRSFYKEVESMVRSMYAR